MAQPNTFLEMTRSLRLYVPALPISLAEQFVRDRYRKVLERRDWSALRREAEFQLNDQKDGGSVAFTRGTTSVTGTGSSFASTDIDRQFKVGQGSAIYTIVDVDVPGQILTLDRAIGTATGSNYLYRIMDAYVTPPSDFMRFIVVTDPLMGWRLRHWVTSAELQTMDPQRNFFGQPYILADRLYNFATAGNSAPQPQYEAWPYTTSARTLYYLYHKRGDDLVQPTDIPIWPIRSDALVSGALADAARWPGTSENPNPYFARPDMWRVYDMEFEDKMTEIERADENIYMTMMEQYPYSNYRLAPMSASFIQSHAL